MNSSRDRDRRRSRSPYHGRDRSRYQRSEVRVVTFRGDHDYRTNERSKYSGGRNYPSKNPNRRHSDYDHRRSHFRPNKEFHRRASNSRQDWHRNDDYFEERKIRIRQKSDEFEESKREVVEERKIRIRQKSDEFEESKREVVLLDNEKALKKYVIKPIVKDLIDDVLDFCLDGEKDENNYIDMCDHFSSRIQEVLHYDPEDSIDMAVAMVQACQETFPSIQNDLLPLYFAALETEKELSENNNEKEFQSDLLEFRRLLHSRLTEKVKEKQADFRFSEVVDLILTYLKTYF